MTRRPLVHGPIFELIPPPPPFRVADQRLYVVFGRETTRMTVAQQRLYMINDFSSVTDYRYWRIWAYDGSDNAYTIAEIEFRDTVGGVDQTGSGTPTSYEDGPSSPEYCYDDDAGTHSGMAFRSGASERAVGYDFGAGVEVGVAEVAITAPTGTSYLPFRNFEIQASFDELVWETKKIVTGEPAWSYGETRTYTI